MKKPPGGGVCHLRGKLAAARLIPIDNSPSPRSGAFRRSTVCASSVTRWRLTWAPSADFRPALRPAPPWVALVFINYTPTPKNSAEISDSSPNALHFAATSPMESKHLPLPMCSRPP